MEQTNRNNAKWNRQIETNKLFPFANQRSMIGHSLKLFKLRGRLNTRRQSFSNRIGNIWNSLTETVLRAASLSIFRSHLNSQLRHQPQTFITACYRTDYYPGYRHVYQEAPTEAEIAWYSKLQKVDTILWRHLTLSLQTIPVIVLQIRPRREKWLNVIVSITSYYCRSSSVYFDRLRPLFIKKHLVYLSTFKVSIGKADSTRQLYMKRPGVKVIQIIGNAREIPRIRTKVKLVRIHIFYKPIKLHLTRSK